MAHITLAIPSELKADMDQFPEMNWVEIAQDAIRQAIVDLKFLKDFTQDSEMTEDDALEMGRELNRKLAARYRKLI
ncbi:MAG TPA: hypothetical protein VKK79_18460 [Candidatus Lokiarchaeia archaeon]|nr:hypothetical protein [Candidatus Lokiarchaeia archaeon]